MELLTSMLHLDLQPPTLSIHSPPQASNFLELEVGGQGGEQTARSFSAVTGFVRTGPFCRWPVQESGIWVTKTIDNRR